MLKKDELTDPLSCMNKAEDDEMTFVLLGRDVAAAATVKFWANARIRLGKNEVDDPQILEARECSEIMEEQSGSPGGTTRRSFMIYFEITSACMQAGLSNARGYHPVTQDDQVDVLDTLAEKLRDNVEVRKMLLSVLEGDLDKVLIGVGREIVSHSSPSPSPPLYSVEPNMEGMQRHPPHQHQNGWAVMGDGENRIATCHHKENAQMIAEVLNKRRGEALARVNERRKGEVDEVSSDDAHS